MWGVSGESSPFCLPPSSTEPLFASSWLLQVGYFSKGWDETPKYTLAAPQQRRPRVQGSTAGSRGWRLNSVATRPGNPHRGVGSAVPAGNTRQAVAGGPTQGCAHTSIFVSRSQQGSCSTAQPYWDKRWQQNPWRRP